MRACASRPVTISGRPGISNRTCRRSRALDARVRAPVHRADALAGRPAARPYRPRATRHDRRRQLVPGVLPLLLSAKPRPPIAVLNVSFLFLDRPDGAPVGMGLPPARNAAELARYAQLKAGIDAVFVAPVRAAWTGTSPISAFRLPPRSPNPSPSSPPDAFLQPSVPNSKTTSARPRTRSASSGCPAGRSHRRPGPGLVDDARSAASAWCWSRRGPSPIPISASSSIRPSRRWPGATTSSSSSRPATARSPRSASRFLPMPASRGFLPFAEILPEIDLLVTNGELRQRLSCAGGRCPDRLGGLERRQGEVGPASAGPAPAIDLATNTPSAAASARCDRDRVGGTAIPARAAAMAEAFARHDTDREILAAIDALVRAPDCRCVIFPPSPADDPRRERSLRSPVLHPPGASRRRRDGAPAAAVPALTAGVSLRSAHRLLPHPED